MEQKNDEILLPMIPGSEFSGEVLEVGDNCKQNFKPGDKIAALLGMLCVTCRNVGYVKNVIDSSFSACE